MFRNKSMTRTLLESHRCSTCSAAPGVTCTTVDGGEPTAPHKAREQARELAELERHLTPEQLAELRETLARIRDSKIPAVRLMTFEDQFAARVLAEARLVAAEVRGRNGDREATVCHDGEGIACMTGLATAIDWMRFMLENT